MPTFTMQEFLTMIANHNTSFWPVALAAYILGVGAVILVQQKVEFASTFAVGVLVLLWLWTGVVFNGLVFSQLFRGMVFVAPLFVIQAILLALAGVVKDQLRFSIGVNVESVVGGLAMLYAAVGYPAVAVLAGRGYPEMLLLGLAPCPTVVFTLGLLLWSRRPLPKFVLAIPVLFALTMGGMAASFGVVEDIGLVIIAVVAASLLLMRDRRVWHGMKVGAHGST